MPSDSQEGRVAVSIRCAMYRDEEDASFAAHFIDFGLIARGQTEGEAVRRCKQLFNKFVYAYRSVGQLEMRLDQAGVQWWWLDDYPKELPEPENTDLLRVPPIIPIVPERQAAYAHFHKAIEAAQQREKESSDIAVAA